jgi:tetratricopeptide (TPR) repeat protein
MMGCSTEEQVWWGRASGVAKKRVRRMAAQPAWRTDWPDRGDLKTWLRAMIQKCDAIADDVAAADKAHLPIEYLAKLGCVTEALRHVDRFLGRLPRDEVLATVRLARVGAKICLDSGRMARMERYLAIAEATEPFNIRKCDRGFSIDSVRRFRADNGLLDPADAIDEEQRVKARFERAARQYKQAIAKGEREAAKLAVAEMEMIAREVEEDWLRRSYLGRVIECYAGLKEAQAVKRCLRRLGESDRHEILNARALVKLGMRAEAIARARQDIANELEQLREMTDPNIHFPVMAIVRSLEFLAEQGAKDEARRWLRRALKEMSTWPVIRHGWTTSSVYHSLAEAMVLIDGPAAAENLLNLAMGDAKAERRGDFRQGSVDASLYLTAKTGRLEEAIEDARKLRSPTQRRKTLARLLAKARRWRELRAVLSQVETPEEAADVAWQIQFELPGGEVR